MKIGKLSNELLQKIVIEKIHFKRPETIARAGVGEDCAVLRLAGDDSVLSTDPITAAVSRVGNLAVHVSCNDIASNGAEPVGILLTVLLPPETTEEQIEEIISQAAGTSADIGVEIIGGHTEITDVVRRPLITSTAIGRMPQGATESREPLLPGDIFIVTKKLAMEGTGILADEHASELEGLLDKDELKRCVAMLDEISVVKEGLIAGRVGFTAMHDITEGGLLGAVWEICLLAEVGAIIERGALPIDDLTVKICDAFDLDPLRLISSGSMLIASRPDKADLLMDELAKAKVAAHKIGVAVCMEDGVMLKAPDGSLSVIDPPGSDEIYKVAGVEVNEL